MATADSALRFNLFAKDQTGAGVRSAESNFSKLGKGLVGTFAAAAGAIGAVSLFKGFIDEAEESAKISRLTENAIRATGGAAKISAAQVGDLATALSNKTAIDDEVIQSGQNLLLTFKGVRNEVGKGNDIFNQASKAALDMTAGMNNGNVTAESLKGTTVQLGKALNDPIKGITALTRSGVTFTDQQKKQIEQMVKVGDTLGAQKIILGELKSEFGGAAAAAASPAQKAQVAWGNLQEQLGTQVLPVFNKVMGFLSNTAIPAVSKLVDNVQHGDGVFAKFRAGLASVGSFVTGTIVPALQQFGAWFQTVGWPAVQRFAQAFWQDLQPAIRQISESFKQDLQPALEGMIRKFQEAWPTIQRVLGILGQVAEFVLTKVVPVLVQFYAKYLATTIRVFGELFAAGWKVIGVLIDLGEGFIKAGKKVGEFISTVAAMPGKAVKAVGDVARTLYQAGIDLIQGFINGIKNKAGEIGGTIKSFVTDKIPGFIKKPLGIGSPSKLTMQYGQWLSEGFAIGIEKGSGKVGDAVKAMVEKAKQQIEDAKNFAVQLRDTFRGLGDLTSLGTEEEGGVDALLAGLRKRVADASAFATTIAKLRKAGLNAASLGQLRDAGPEGGLAAAQQLLAGGSSAISEVNSLTRSLNRTGRDFANRESRLMYGFGGLTGPTPQDLRLIIDLRGDDDDMMRRLRKRIRAEGGNVQAVLGQAS